MESIADTDSLGARFRDVEIDKSTKRLSRTILGQVPVVTIDGPKKIDEFESNENDVDNPIRNDGIHPPCFVDAFRGQRALKFDLMHNFDTFVRKDHYALDLGEKILWLEQKLKTQPGLPLSQVLGNVDFFTSRGVLKLMGSAPFTAFPWKIIAFKYQGVIFVFDVKPDYERGMDTDKSDYMGHKFHQYVTANSPTGKPDTNKLLNTYHKYMVMLRSSFECEGSRLSCLFSWKMSCADPDGNGIELKTEVAGMKPSERLAMKYAGWWMESKLANIREVIVGEKPYGNSRLFPNRPVCTTVVAVKSVKVLDNVDFFTGRGVLKLMGSAPFTAFPWKIVAFKYRGVIFVFDIKPDHEILMESIRSDYMGHKFHQYVTADSPTGKPDTNKPLNTYEKYGLMLRSSFECEGKRFSCLFSRKMDSADPDGNGIELRTEMAGLTPSERLAMKYAGWWMGCKLANISEVIVGEKPYVYSRKFAHGPKSATVVAVNSIKVDELPKMSNGTLYWKPDKFIFFLHRFIAEVKATLDAVPEGTLLVAELPSSTAKSIEIHLEQHGQSNLDFFYKELDKRISKYL